jgi:ectoine hydroxylase-related dioxygenase (phytanoyl-CoA dioxygenase family)
MQVNAPHVIHSFASNGYAVIPDLLSPRDADKVACAIVGILGKNAGTRRLLNIEWCAKLAGRLAGEQRLGEFLPANARAVQCTLFAKTAESNWLVSLHQDLSIPVAERVESAACSGWSQKQGDTFVQPPISVLEKVLAVRLHLDDCDERNGALRVVPGSHCLGRLSSDEALRTREARGEHVVSVPKGGAMIMRPLLLHASSKSSVAVPRRVLHFVYGPATLPEGLNWPPRKIHCRTSARVGSARRRSSRRERLSPATLRQSTARDTRR